MASDSLHADSRSARHSGHLPSHAGAHTAGTHSHMGGAVRTGAASGTAGGACGTGTLGGLCAAENGMAGGCHTGKASAAGFAGILPDTPRISLLPHGGASANLGGNCSGAKIRIAFRRKNVYNRERLRKKRGNAVG